MILFDSHCHLDRFPRHVAIGDIVERAAAAGVHRFFVPGVTGFPARIVELAGFSQIMIGWGVHPLYAESFNENCCDEIAAALKKSICRAIGECGFDRRAPVNFTRQEAAFQWQIDLALETGMPLIVHLVGHFERALAMLKQAGPELKFVIHSFAGSYEVAQRFLEIGAWISFSGSVLQKNHDLLQRLVRLVPDDKILVETDSPDQAPEFWKGSLNEPASLREIATRLAGIRGVAPAALCELSNKNYQCLFKMDYE